MDYIAYTDGSYGENGDKKAYGSAAIYKNENDTQWTVLTSVGKDPNLLSHRNVAGEVLAVLQLCKHFLNNVKDCTNLTIVYDYIGIENWVTGTWKAKKELTINYRSYMREVVMKRIHINFKHTKGHSGDAGNTEVDKIVNRVVQDYLYGSDI